VNPPLLENILAQPESLRQIADHQLGDGRRALEHSAEILHQSRRIVLTGMGASLFASIPLSYSLAARGVAVSVMETSELLYFLAPTLSEDTAVIIVSRSGESIEITKLLPILKQRRCRSIGVFNVPGSTLAKETEEQLFLSSPADELVAIQTYTGTLFVLGLLEAAYVHEMGTASVEINETVSALTRLIAECSSLCKSRNDLIDSKAPLYLLARGAALASVHEGVLLMHEVAKAPAVGMSVPQFRHGPVEAVHGQFRAVVFGTQPETADLDFGLAHDLTNMGAQVVCIGAGNDAAKLLSVANWPENIPRRFASILEIVPLQFLSYYTALARGIAPGKFRFAPAITTSEVGFLS
jgi:glucosamine--fructose-6-phosphate aminotransferase (isomerizing)